MPDPEFEGQTKTRLGNPEVRKVVEGIVSQVGGTQSRRPAAWPICLPVMQTLRANSVLNSHDHRCCSLVQRCHETAMQDVGEALEMDGSALADILGKALQVRSDRCMRCTRAAVGHSIPEGWPSMHMWCCRTP